MTLLALLDRLGVDKAGAPKAWPVDVVTQVLRDHPEEFFPIRGGLTKRESTRMRKKIEREWRGGWWYETIEVKDRHDTYTVVARATQKREAKFVRLRGRAAYNSAPDGPPTDEERHFPGIPVSEDTEGTHT